ncbi:hypothetical protein NHQ30_008672 [Ciborinia camelliae]|nr:hypothetical protein NHQ30_008672 [Ciborinia camelliae]
MARQAEHQKAPAAGCRRSGENAGQVAKSKTSKNKVYKISKASKVISPQKNSRERTKKSVVVKPIAKNDVRKLQHARSSQSVKHTCVVEPSPQPDDLADAFHKSLEGARTHILNDGRKAFDNVHTALIQKLADNKAKDRSFLENVLHIAQALGAPLTSEKLETTVQHKSRRVCQVFEIGKRVDQFKQTIEVEENKLESYWKQYESLQNEYIKFCAQVFGGDAIEEDEEDEGYRNDMKSLDTEHATQMNVLMEELDEVGHEAIKKMKASEKVYSTPFHFSVHIRIHGY